MFSSKLQMRKEPCHLWFILAIRRFDGEHVVAPSRPRGPPSEALPDILVLFHVVDHVLNGCMAIGGVCRGKFSEEGALMVLAAPLGEVLQSLAAGCCAHDLGVGSRTVAIEVLMNLDNCVV